ncbi:universal stress protein [Devosia nitrariae]|uniref:Universal stress protein A n=1 Tax=Devosia nitrariae TaxID=2071872 RepID=A0ABQ5W910_9HYPH|nr:universal stress protein [Devosia nitrariae]GLQ56600.1 universal stress protein A [Devosia nitrariae]
MDPHRLAYVPLATYPEPVPDETVLTVLDYAAVLGARVHVTAFAVDIPPVYTPLAGRIINIPDMIRATEEDSRQHCRRLTNLAGERAKSLAVPITCSIQKAVPGQMDDIAIVKSRYFDISLLAWSKELAVQDLAQSIVFGSGRPSILLPARKAPSEIKHVAIAWDESRVAARALADSVQLLGHGVRVTVLTVHDEKPLSDHGVAASLAAFLKLRGTEAGAENLSLNGRSVSFALQARAIEIDADLLVMGAYGHSRIRDFVLGGATTGVFSDLRLPVLLSH